MVNTVKQMKKEFHAKPLEEKVLAFPQPAPLKLIDIRRKLQSTQYNIPDILFAPEILIPGTEAASRFKSAARESLKFSKYRRGLEIPRGHIKGTRGPSIPKTGGYVLAIVKKEGTARFSHEEKFRSQLYGSSPRSPVGQTLGDVTNEVNPVPYLNASIQGTRGLSSRSDLLYDQLTGSLKGDFEHGTLGPIVSKLPGKYSSASKAEEALLRRKLSSENTRTKAKGIRFPIIDSRFNKGLPDILGDIPFGASDEYFTGIIGERIPLKSLTEDIGKGLYRDLLASTTKDLPANIKSEYAAIKYLASRKMEGGKLGEITIDKKILELEELEKTLPMYEPSFGTSGHYGKDNMGWYRGGSFDAAEKLLFLVDEFQSDQWATIRAKIRLLKKEQKKIIGDIKAGETGSYTDIHGELHAFTKHTRDFEGKLGKVIGDDIKYIQSKVAGLKNWRDTAIRYGMIEAVKRGADNYTWVGGSAIAERFSLGKVYDTIVWTKHSDDTYSLGGRPKSGKFNEVLRAHQGTQQLEASHLPPEELPLWVGEEVTDKITKGVGFNKAGFSEDIPIPLEALKQIPPEVRALQPKDTRGILNVKDLEVESRWAYGVYGDTKKVIEKKFPNEPSMLKYAWDGDNANMTATTLKTFLKRVLPDKAALTEAKASMGAYGVPQKDTGERFVVARQIDVDKVPEGQFADHMALVDKVDGVFHTQEEAYKFVKENRPYKITKDYADVPRTHTLSSPSKYTEETSVWRIFEVKRPYKEERVMPVEKEIYRDGVDIIDDALDNTVFRVRKKDLQAVTEKINAPLQSPGPSQSFGSIPLNKKIIEAVKKGLSPIAMLPFMGWLLFGGDNEAEAGIISSGIKTAKDIAIKTAEKTAKTAREAARITAEKTKAVIPKAKLGEPSTKGEAFLKDVVRMQEKSEQQNRLTLDKAKRFLNTSIVDVKGHTKRALASYAKHSLDARLAIQRLDLIGGAHSKAIQDSSAAEAIIYGGLSKSKHILLDAFINAKRTIEIIKNKGKKFKVPPEFKKAQAFLDEMSPALKAELEPRAKAYWETFDALVAMMKAENLLSPEALAGLRKSGRNYSPRKVLEYFDPELTFTFGESKIIKVGTSGLKPLQKGTIKDIETNTSILLNEAIVRAHTRVFRNRANKSLYDFAKNVPHNGIATLSKVVRVTKSGKQIFQKPPLGYVRIPVMIKGKRKEVLMRHEFAKGWVLRDPILNPAIANTLSWVSGSKILKAMATGLNPEFSLTNLPRDLAHILLITDEYSRTLPVAFIQLIQDITMIIPSATGIRPIRGGKSLVKTLKHKGVKGVFNKKDLQKVLKDTFNREGLYRDYINYGGGMEFMTHQGKFARSEFGRLTKVVPESVITQLGNVQTYLGYVGETSEIIGRLALMRRAMKNGATLEEATWIARTYLDFSQGGNIVKAMDSFVPYLNASIQGTRGIFRAARDKPGVFGYKAAQIQKH
jgi:hypothetical protein